MSGTSVKHDSRIREVIRFTFSDLFNGYPANSRHETTQAGGQRDLGMVLTEKVKTSLAWILVSTPYSIVLRNYIKVIPNHVQSIPKCRSIDLLRSCLLGVET